MLETINQNTSNHTMTTAANSTSLILPPTRHEVGRFRETHAVVAMRALLRGLQTVSPALVAHAGYYLITRPPRGPERDWQTALRRQARTWRLPHGKGQIAAYEWGRGPTVLMVHGWGARATHMGRMIMPLVQEGMRVVAFDAPAHGESTGSTTDPLQFAGAIDTVSRFVGAPDIILAHSFGAAAAMLARRDWGVKAERHVLISSFAHFHWLLTAFAQYLRLPESTITHMQAMMATAYGDGFSWEQASVVEMLRRTATPTLLVHDKTDGEIPFQHALALGEAGAHVQLHHTSGLGHHKLLGDAAVIERVLRFCTSQ